MEVRKMQNYKLKLKNPEIRFLNDIKKVLYDKNWAKSAPNFKLYYMYRGVKEKDGLRYDVTVIPPKMLGKEFVKTKGNRNSNNFSEFYTVLQGQALFLMQKTNGKTAKDALAIKAVRGDSVIEPAGYAIIAINPSKKTLKMGNWISRKNKNIYKEIETMNGACYFYTKSGWIKNKNYESVPKLRFEKPLKSMPKIWR